MGVMGAGELFIVRTWRKEKKEPIGRQSMTGLDFACSG